MQLTHGQKQANEVLRRYRNLNWDDKNSSEISLVIGAMAGTIQILRNEVQTWHESTIEQRRENGRMREHARHIENELRKLHTYSR